MQQQVAWHFEEEVADEEHPRAESVDRFAEVKVLEHLQPRKPDVHTVQVGDDVAEHQEWQQPPGDPGVDSVSRLRRGLVGHVPTVYRKGGKIDRA